MCSAIEANEHSVQLLEALSKIFPPGEGDLRVTQLLSGLACTAYPTRDALYKQLDTLCILQRESALRSANKTDEPILDVLRKARYSPPPRMSSILLPRRPRSPALEQSLKHQNMACALLTLASHRGGKGGQQQPSKPSSGPTRGGSCGCGSRGHKPYSRPCSPRWLAPINLRVFGEEGEGGRSLDR